MWISQLAPEGRPRIPASRGLPCAPAVQASLPCGQDGKSTLVTVRLCSRRPARGLRQVASAGEPCASSRLGAETPGLDREFLKTQNSSLPSVSSGKWFKCDYRPVY